jgi:arylsulfatase A-like enzyme
MARRVTRREFIGTAVGAAAIAGTAGASASAAPARPNVLFILADDLGYGDLSCYGRPDYKTPVLDALAAQGVKFTSAYAAAPVCTPTRCAYITGRYPQRLPVGLEEPLKGSSSPDVGLPPDHPTVASLLKQNGYATALVGKWHLGWKPEFGPNRHGFDEFFGILSGAADYFTHRASDRPGTAAGGAGGVPDLWENLTPTERVGYLTDLLSDRAAEIIARPHTKPFFLSLQYTAPHSPWEGPEDAAIGHTNHGPGPMVEGGSPKIYGAMMKSMDAGIGRVLKALERAKLERDTLVIFTSDNGGERYSYNWPFSFQKMFLFEGGTRVPAIVRWPGVIPAGRVTDQAAITMDWTATILGVTGTAPDPAYPLDGENLLAACTGERAVYDRALFWRITGFDAARVGKWKYLKDARGEYLFDLSSDPGEKADAKRQNAAAFDRVKQQYLRWQAQMLPLAQAPASAPQKMPMNTIAERYVKLVLALGQHDADYVDAFYGPPEWKIDAERQRQPLSAIAAAAEQLIVAIPELSDADRRDELVVLRRDYLKRQLEALRARVRMLDGVKLTFDEESQALYDAAAPTHPDSYFAAILEEISAALPGDGPLIDRYDAFRQKFIVPSDRLGQVFDRAIAECRGRALPHVQLPPNESFTVEYVRNKPWSGYNWYQGNYHSLIQVNTDLPVYIDRAIDLACHEGYPGHHVYNALLEKNLVRDRGWVEFSVYALFSPQSLIAEGTANYGIEVAFPGEERLAFEREVLFPLAGLDPSQAAAYAKVRALVDRLAYAGNEAARKYLNGQLTRTQTVEWLTRYAMMPAAAAEQRTKFYDTYRSYVINYNLGKDLVKQYVESRGGTASQPGKRWQEFVQLLASPRLPSALRAPAVSPR